MNRLNSIALPVMILVLLCSTVLAVHAQAPLLPSIFSGSIEVIDNPLVEGSVIEAYLPAYSESVAVTSAVLVGEDLTYTIVVPADIPGEVNGGTEGDPVTFRCEGRVLAVGVWHEDTNVNLNFHPPAAGAGDYYAAFANQSMFLSASAVDWLATDTFTYAWDLDGDGFYDDSSLQAPMFIFDTTGTHTVEVRVTDQQGGQGIAAAEVVVVSLDGLTGNIYDGSPHAVEITGVEAPFSYSVTYAGMPDAPVDAGNYSVVVQVLTGEILIGGLSDILVIDPRAAVVTTNPAEKVYNEADPAFSGSLSGFLESDGVTAIYSREVGENVGTYPITAGLSPVERLDNYDITENFALFTITARPVTVTPASGQTKVYGNDDPVLTYSASEAGVPFTGVLGRAAGETVGSYAILQGTLQASNYNVLLSPVNFSITPRPASVTPDSLGKVYGNSDPALTGTLSNFVPADGVTAVYTRAAGENVNTYGISASLAPAPVLNNYTITYNTALFTINPRPVSVTPDARSKVYGASDPALTGTLSNFIPTDNIIATYTRAAGENVNSYLISAALNPTGALGNYTITYNTAIFTITARPITVAADNLSKIIGETDPLLTYTITNGLLVYGDHFSGSLLRAAGESVGTYVISQGTLQATSNYILTFVPGVFTILPLFPPDIVLSGAPAPFHTLSGQWSIVQSYTISGISLSNPIIITAPANFEISLSSSGGFGTTLTIHPTDGIVPPTLIYIRFYSAMNGTSIGSITHNCTGAPGRVMPVSGTAWAYQIFVPAVLGIISP